jgi:predicted kinase
MEASGLSAAQPLLILVVGIPGSGKSFFARQFAESYKFFYIDSGRYESELEGLHSSNQEISEVAKKLANATYEQALKCFKHIVLEGSFNSAREREDMLSKAKKAGFGTLIAWVQTDEETAQARALNRDRRRADDKNSLEINQDEFNHIAKSFQNPNPKKEVFVVVSGKHDFKSQSVVVLKKIASMYVKGINAPKQGSSNNPAATMVRRILR